MGKIGGLLRSRGVTLPTGGWSDKRRFRGDLLSARYFGTTTNKQPLDNGDDDNDRQLSATLAVVEEAGASFPPFPAVASAAGEAPAVAVMIRQPAHLVWLRGKCHGGVRSKCTKEPRLCSAQQTAEARAHRGKVSTVRLSLARAFERSGLDTDYGGTDGGHGSGRNNGTTVAAAGVGGSSFIFPLLPPQRRRGRRQRPWRESEVALEWTSLGGDRKHGPVECPGITPYRHGGSSRSRSVKALKASEYEAHGTKEGVQRYFEAMLDAWFSFCAHGDERWNLRFLELLSAGTM